METNTETLMFYLQTKTKEAAAERLYSGIVLLYIHLWVLFGLEIDLVFLRNCLFSSLVTVEYAFL